MKQTNYAEYAKDKFDNVVQYIQNKYSEHPSEVNMTATQHFLFVLKVSGLSIASGLLLLLHAITPWWFTQTGGDLLLYTSDLIQQNRNNLNNRNNHNIEMDTLDTLDALSDNEEESTESAESTENDSIHTDDDKENQSPNQGISI